MPEATANQDLRTQLEDKPSLTELAELSRRMIEDGSKSFARAAKLMPPDVRDSVYMLYAWCRHCDDCIDDQHLGFPATANQDASDLDTRVDQLRRKTRAACAGRPPAEPVFQALAEVIGRHDIPERYPLDLIDGFAMDARDHVYRTEEDTLLYCYHVAGAVGIMMAMVMGVRDRATLLRACDLGIAFQLTNIARDVTADKDIDRIYLPATWLEDAGLTAENFCEPTNRKALFGVVSRLLDRADEHYDSAAHGLPALPYRCAWSIASARRIYRAIGTEVRNRGPNAWHARVTTTSSQKVAHITAAAADAAHARTIAKLAPPPARGNLWTPPALRETERTEADEQPVSAMTA